MSGRWDALAPTYVLQRPLERAAVERLLDLLAPRPRDRLLDLGTGTGAVLAALAARTCRPAEAIGVDSSAAMLARVPPLPAGWSVFEGDATGLRLPDACFDAISASYLLHVLAPTDRERAVAEMARLLRPGGRVAVAVPALLGGVAMPPYRQVLRGLERISPSAFGLLAIDARAALVGAGLPPVRGSYVRRGYPTVCLLAERLN